MSMITEDDEIELTDDEGDNESDNEEEIEEGGLTEEEEREMMRLAEESVTREREGERSVGVDPQEARDAEYEDREDEHEELKSVFSSNILHPWDDIVEWINYKRDVIKNLGKRLALKRDWRDIGLILKKRLTPNHYAQLRQMRDIVHAIYPDRYDIQSSFSLNVVDIDVHNRKMKFKIEIDTIYFVIHFPIVHIKNSKGDQHEIKDLYVRIPLDVFSTKFSFQKVQGTRMTITEDEYKAGYYHSHITSQSTLSGVAKGTYNTFCIGTSTDLALNIATLNVKYDPLTFEMYVLELASLVEWESLEGVPYTKIEYITKNENSTYPIDYGQTELDDAYRRLEGSLQKRLVRIPDLTWKFDNNHYSIVQDEKYDRFLSKYLEPYLVYQDERGRYYLDRDNRRGTNVTFPSDTSMYWIAFRKEKKTFKIIKQEKDNNTEEVVAERQKFIHDKIKTYVRSKLEYKANYAKIRENRIKQLSTTNST